MLSYQIFNFFIASIQSHHMLEVGSAPGVHPIQCALQMKKLVVEKLSDIFKFTKPESDMYNWSPNLGFWTQQLSVTS